MSTKVDPSENASVDHQIQPFPKVLNPNGGMHVTQGSKMTVEAVKTLAVGGVVELDGYFWVIIGNNSEVLTLCDGTQVLRIGHKAPSIEGLKRIR